MFPYVETVRSNYDGKIHVCFKELADVEALYHYDENERTYSHYSKMQAVDMACGEDIGLGKNITTFNPHQCILTIDPSSITCHKCRKGAELRQKEFKKRYKTFLYKFEDCHRKVVKVSERENTHINSNIWKTHFVIAGLTEYMDYECNFNNKGNCKAHGYDDMCCCNGCKSSLGYYEKNVPGILIEFLAKNFNADNGFWREGVGCILPRSVRSVACLAHHCKYELSTEDMLLLSALKGNDSFLLYQLLKEKQKEAEQK